MLRRFQIPYLEKEGYVNIRCAWSLGCPAEIKPLYEEGEHREAVHAGGDYKKAFEVLFPGLEVPREVGVSCCAQFAATKEKITERKKEEYVHYRDWLLETQLGDSISGRVMEYSWHSKSFHFSRGLLRSITPCAISNFSPSRSADGPDKTFGIETFNITYCQLFRPIQGLVGHHETFEALTEVTRCIWYDSGTNTDAIGFFHR